RAGGWKWARARAAARGSRSRSRPARHGPSALPGGASRNPHETGGGRSPPRGQHRGFDKRLAAMHPLSVLRSHPAFRSAWLIWLVMLVTAAVTRAVLAGLAWNDLDLSPAALLDIAV